MGWLKEVADSNMAIIKLTLETSHPPMGWLKEVADSNMEAGE
jgi:hypothetical protein